MSESAYRVMSWRRTIDDIRGRACLACSAINHPDHISPAGTSIQPPLQVPASRGCSLRFHLRLTAAHDDGVRALRHIDQN